jgi:hypothetical protein
LIKKFFPEDVSSMTMPHSDDNHDILLKTIRLSKNIFSLTERLPKAKYRSPKAISGGELLTEKKSKVNLLPANDDKAA